MKTCFIAATKKEASVFIEASRAIKIWQKDQASFFSSDSFDILICGIGPLYAALSVGWLYNMNHQEWINIGIAGSLKDSFTIGEIFEASCARSDFVGLPSQGYAQKIQWTEKGLTVFSSSEGIHDANKREALSESADLVDMEVYSLARAAQANKTPFRSFKVVSDLCSEQEDFKVIISRIPTLMRKLWKTQFSDMIPQTSKKKS